MSSVEPQPGPPGGLTVTPWEYQSVQFKAGDLSANVAYLNNLGAYGWQVVGMVGDPHMRFTLCYLGRPNTAVFVSS
jgi:hypothetical protein